MRKNKPHHDEHVKNEKKINHTSKARFMLLAATSSKTIAKIQLGVDMCMFVTVSQEPSCEGEMEESHILQCISQAQTRSSVV